MRQRLVSQNTVARTTQHVDAEGNGTPIRIEDQNDWVQAANCNWIQPLKPPTSLKDLKFNRACSC